jgi:hypothetical protein
MPLIDEVTRKQISRRDFSFLFGLLIIILTIFLSAGVYFHLFQFRFLVGPLFLSHWLSWIGTAFIAFFTPTYYLLKLRYPKNIRRLLRFHCLGYLLAFMFISIHFFSETPRGTGEALYLTTLILVVSGFIFRFRLLRMSIGSYNISHIIRYIHLSVVMTFYIVIVIHVIQHMGAP